jgi:hypothetical protein
LRVPEEQPTLVTLRVEGRMLSHSSSELDVGVPVHDQKVRLLVRVRTAEPRERLDRLAALVARYCPVDSLMRAAVPDYEVSWERLV